MTVLELKRKYTAMFVMAKREQLGGFMQLEKFDLLSDFDTMLGEAAILFAAVADCEKADKKIRTLAQSYLDKVNAL